MMCDFPDEYKWTHRDIRDKDPTIFKSLSFEPETSALQGQRSTAELWAHYDYKIGEE